MLPKWLLPDALPEMTEKGRRGNSLDIGASKYKAKRSVSDRTPKQIEPAREVMRRINAQGGRWKAPKL